MLSSKPPYCGECQTTYANPRFTHRGSSNNHPCHQPRENNRSEIDSQKYWYRFLISFGLSIEEGFCFFLTLFIFCPISRLPLISIFLLSDILQRLIVNIQNHPPHA